MIRLFSRFVIVLLFAAPEVFAQETPAVRLHPGRPVSDSLSSDDVHTYAIDLDAGQFVYGEANQKTVDVVVTLYAPDKSVITKIDGPAVGPEVLQFESETAGEYRIEVAPFEKAQGRYTIELQRVEPLAKTPEARVDQLMAAFDGDDVPGGVVAVIKDGEIVFSESYGMANLTHSIPFSVETRTNIGSTSKQFTAFAIALLEAQGKLSLDDDIREHIPELPDFGKTVTLRHLLTHTSGYREFLNTLALTGRRLDEGDFVARDELIDIVKRQPALQNDPGAEWNYNNTGFGLLTVVVERVTGETFPAWMKDNVFRPLGMNDTFVRSHQAEIISNSAQGYTPAEDGGYRNAGDLGGAMGAGGIYTTVGDLAKWIRNFETAEVGGDSVIQAMTAPFVLTGGDTTSYGLGLFVDEQRGLERIQHGGADIAHRSMLMYFPEIDGGVITLSNNSTFPGGIPQEVAEAFFEEQMDPADAEPADTESATAEVFDPKSYDPQTFDDVAGSYALDAAPNFVMTFMREDSTLYTQATGQPRVEIVPTSDSTFKLLVVDASLTFHREADGSVTSLTLHQNGDHRAHRIDDAGDELTAAEYEAYAGVYYSEELEIYYALAMEDSALVLRHRRLDDIKLNPTKKDVFSGGFPVAEVSFERDKDGRVTGFTVSNVRTRGVRFERVSDTTSAASAAPAQND